MADYGRILAGYLVTYDPEVDAMYIQYPAYGTKPYAGTTSLDQFPFRNIDVAADGTVLGVELLFLADWHENGVTLDGLPNSDDLRLLLSDYLDVLG